MQDFTGKVAVITGAASGIGEGLARHCVKEGMSVLLADVNQPALDKLREELGRQVVTAITDVSSAAAVESLAEFAYQQYGQVDLLFNNAGVLISGYSWERSVEDWQWILNINLMGVVHGIHSFVPRMLKQGTAAHIVNTSSLAGLLAAPLMGPYTVGKQAVVALTETLHYELESIGASIKTSVLCPGPIATGIAGSGTERKQQSSIGSQANDQLMGFLSDGISAGMPASECAEKVFSAIRNQQFWIFTHEDFKDEYRRKVEGVLANVNPEYQVYVTEE